MLTGGRAGARILLPVMLIMLLILTPLGAAPAAIANGDSCGGEPADVVGRPLVIAPVETVAAPSMFELLRFVLLSGQTAPLLRQPGPAVYMVDSGYGEAEIDGEATLMRATLDETSVWDEPQQVSGAVSFGYGDQLTVPARVSSVVANTGTVPLVVLVVRVVPVADYLSSMLNDGLLQAPGIAVLGRGVFEEVPAPAATIALVRLIFRADADASIADANVGPVLVHVEAGALGYTLVDGVAGFASNGAPEEAFTPAVEQVIEPGGFVVEQPQTSSRLRSVSSERTWVLIAQLVPSDRPVEDVLADLPT
jgi:hypothetical protein